MPIWNTQEGQRQESVRDRCDPHPDYGGDRAIAQQSDPRRTGRGDGITDGHPFDADQQGVGGDDPAEGGLGPTAGDERSCGRQRNKDQRRDQALRTGADVAVRIAAQTTPSRAIWTRSRSTTPAMLAYGDSPLRGLRGHCASLLQAKDRCSAGRPRRTVGPADSLRGCAGSLPAPLPQSCGRPRRERRVRPTPGRTPARGFTRVEPEINPRVNPECDVTQSSCGHA